MATPLLEVIRARIDVAGVPAIDGLSLASTGDRILVLGAARALFEAASGLRRVSHGEVRLSGVQPLQANRGRSAAGAPLDPPLPPKWTPYVYAAWSARLAGHPPGTARLFAQDAIDRLKMDGVGNEPLAKALPQVRRATVIAAALATGAKILLLEDPLASLPEEVARNFARVVARGLADRTWALFAGRIPLQSRLAMEADEAIVIAGNEVAAQGAPAELASRERSFVLRVGGEAAAFARLAGERGARVKGAAERLLVDLGEGLKVSDLLRVAVDTRATIVELYPLVHALT